MLIWIMFFCGKLFCDCSLEVQILSRFYYGKIVFNGNISMVFYIYLYLYTCIQMGCLGFVFEKYLATSNKNLFSTSGTHSSPKSEHVWYCLRKLFEKLKQMNSQYLFSRNKGEITPFYLAFSQLYNLFSFFKKYRFLVH